MVLEDCGELTLAGFQVPTKPLYQSTISPGQDRENKMENKS